MFCSKCGNQIPDNSVFCSACGAQVNQAGNIQFQAQFQAQKNAIRQSEIQAVNNAINYFSQQKYTFEKFYNTFESVNYYKRGAKSGLIIWGAILCFLGFFASITGTISAITERTLVIPTLAVFFFIFSVPGMLMIIGGILMKINNRKKYKKAVQDYNEASAEINNIYASYTNCPVGMEYCNPNVLHIILNILESGRADTVKEAVNLLMQKTDRRKHTAYIRSIDNNITPTKIYPSAVFAIK